MLRKFVVISFAAALVAALGFADAQEKGKEKRKGTITGELKSRKDTSNGKNVILEILASGEEKARPYHVQYDPKAKGPMADVLAAAKEAKIGDRVQCDWIDTGEGLAITSFLVLKKKEDSKDK